MWNVWIVTPERTHLFVAQYATQALARWWEYAWLDRGFFPVKHDIPSVEYAVPKGSILYSYLQETNDPPPSQVITGSTVWREIGA